MASVLIQAQRDLDVQENSCIAKTARVCRPFSVRRGLDVDRP
jgi:hypothetical protein